MTWKSKRKIVTTSITIDGAAVELRVQPLDLRTMIRVGTTAGPILGPALQLVVIDVTTGLAPALARVLFELDDEAQLTAESVAAFLERYSLLGESRARQQGLAALASRADEVNVELLVGRAAMTMAPRLAMMAAAVVEQALTTATASQVEQLVEDLILGSVAVTDHPALMDHEFVLGSWDALEAWLTSHGGGLWLLARLLAQAMRVHASGSGGGRSTRPASGRPTQPPG